MIGCFINILRGLLVFLVAGLLFTYAVYGVPSKYTANAVVITILAVLGIVVLSVIAYFNNQRIRRKLVSKGSSRNYGSPGAPIHM